MFYDVWFKKESYKLPKEKYKQQPSHKTFDPQYVLPKIYARAMVKQNLEETSTDVWFGSFQETEPIPEIVWVIKNQALDILET